MTNRTLSSWSLLVVLTVPTVLISQTRNSPYANMPGLSGADALDNLAAKAITDGDVHEAFWLQEEALAIATRRLAPTDFQRAKFLLHQAEYAFQLNLGDLSHALYQQAVALYGTSHMDDLFIPALLSLAQIDEGRGKLEEARTLAERAVRECDARCRGPLAGFSKQQAHEALGSLLYRQGRFDDADRELDKAMQIAGPSPFTSAISNRRADIRIARGQYEIAKQMLLKAPPISRDTNALARAQAGLDDVPAAVSTLRQSFEQSFREIGRFLPEIDGPAGEASLIRAASNLPGHLGTAMFLDEEYGDRNPELRALVATMAVNRVGLTSDLVTDMYLRLRRDVSPRDADRLREMFRMRSQAALWARHYGRQQPDSEERVREYSRRSRAIEVDLLKKYEGAIGDFKIVSLTDLATKLPADTALVQIAKFTPPTGAAKYRAYIVRRNHPVQAVTLGEASAIDGVAQDFRSSLVRPSNSNPTGRRRLSRDAGKLLWDKIKPLCGSRVVLVPDAGLLSTSFEALTDENGKFVGETTSITYLSSARELDFDAPASVYIVANAASVTMATARPTGPPIVFANPDFGLSDPGGPVHWKAIPETGQDALDIKSRHGDVTIRLAREASRAALQTIVSPAFLHIGSHAFYATSAQSRVGVLIDDAVEPMLAGGVALAGANKPALDDDGIASPVDFASLDLRGTELVFVSACSSGDGTVRDGEGLYGIRRALRLAGSRAQILALWEVDRKATSQFVRAFYQTWPGSGSVEDAFKAAQRQVRASWSDDPYYWAAFTLSGTPIR
jgi:CHAT domain-containing protein